MQRLFDSNKMLPPYASISVIDDNHRIPMTHSFFSHKDLAEIPALRRHEKPRRRSTSAMRRRRTSMRHGTTIIHNPRGTAANNNAVRCAAYHKRNSISTCSSYEKIKRQESVTSTESISPFKDTSCPKSVRMPFRRCDFASEDLVPSAVSGN